MPVTSSQAVAYKGGGRRYLTLKSACKAEARALINTRCDCEYMDYGGSIGGEWLTCWWHEEERNAVLMRRLTGGYMRRYRADQKQGEIHGD